ncbi:MAG: hypothetical protein AAF677_00980 [Pseudomonadota bacterium]
MTRGAENAGVSWVRFCARALAVVCSTLLLLGGVAGADAPERAPHPVERPEDLVARRAIADAVARAPVARAGPGDAGSDRAGATPPAPSAPGPSEAVAGGNPVAAAEASDGGTTAMAAQLDRLLGTPAARAVLEPSQDGAAMVPAPAGGTDATAAPAASLEQPRVREGSGALSRDADDTAEGAEDRATGTVAAPGLGVPLSLGPVAVCTLDRAPRREVVVAPTAPDEEGADAEQGGDSGQSAEEMGAQDQTVRAEARRSAEDQASRFAPEALLARLGPPDSERLLRRRPTSDAVAELLHDLVVACDTVTALERLDAAWADMPADATLGRVMSAEAWPAVRGALVDAPPDLQAALGERLARRQLLAGRPAPVVLIAPFVDDRVPQAARALIEAHVALAEGRREGAVAALAALTRQDTAAGQIATVLLAEQLDPREETPIAGGWLAHLDLVGAVGTEHAGTAFGTRAGLAEVGLTDRVLGRAAAMRTLSLLHLRGVLDAAELERTVAAWGDPVEDDAISLEVWRAADPGSLAGLDRLARPDGGEGPGARSGGADLGGRAAAHDGTLGRDDRATPAGVGSSDPAWRSRVSASGDLRRDDMGDGAAPPGVPESGGRGPDGNLAAVSPDRDRPPGAPGAAPSVPLGAGTFALDALPPGLGGSTPPAGPEGSDLLDAIEVLLQETGRDIEDAKGVLRDG